MLGQAFTRQNRRCDRFGLSVSWPCPTPRARTRPAINVNTSGCLILFIQRNGICSLAYNSRLGAWDVMAGGLVAPAYLVDLPRQSMATAESHLHGMLDVRFPLQPSALAVLPSGHEIPIFGRFARIASDDLAGSTFADVTPYPPYPGEVPSDSYKVTVTASRFRAPLSDLRPVQLDGLRQFRHDRKGPRRDHLLVSERKVLTCD